MRILHVLYFSDMGGIESYAGGIFQALQTRGHENVVLYDGAEPPGIPERPGNLHREPGLIAHGRDHGGRLVRSVLRWLDREACDLAFLHTTMNRELAEAILERLPTVYFAHTYDAFCPSGALLYEASGAICELKGVPEARCLVNAYLKRCNTRHPGRLWRRYRRTSETAAWTRRADAVVCASEYVRRRHVENGWPGERIHLTPYPIALPAARSDPGTARDRIVLFAGRITPQKGLEYLIRAVREIDRPHTLVVAGDGYLLPAMRALAGRLGIADRVSFRGGIDHAALADLYARAAVLAVPSVWPEPFGLVGPEAMTHGLPVVAFRVGGIPEWLRDGETGYLVEPRDIIGLARGIRRLLNDPALVRRLGERGRRVVQQNFTFDRHVGALERIFRDTVEARRPAPDARAVTVTG
jgi:glycosyltransferase involved in cell wall biosynthesis